MLLSEKNNILSKVSEVLLQCQFLIQSLSRVDAIDDLFQSTIPSTKVNIQKSKESFPDAQEVAKFVPDAQEVAKFVPNAQEVAKLLDAIKSLAPSYIYDPKKAKKKRMMKMKKGICPDLLSIWTNATTILSPVQRSIPSSAVQYPTVD